MRKSFGLVALLSLLMLLFPAKAFTAVDTTLVNILDYSSTNVTTGAYVTLVASVPRATSSLQVCDTSTKLLKLAKGSSGNEVDLFTVQISGCVIVTTLLEKGSRLSIKAVNSNATTGFNTVSFLP